MNKSRKFACSEKNSIDSLAYMTDEELAMTVARLEAGRAKAASAGADDAVYEWEVELAYAQRENMIRSVRHRAHTVYLRDVETWFNSSEAGLPQADMNNDEYIKLHQMWKGA